MGFVMAAKPGRILISRRGGPLSPPVPHRNARPHTARPHSGQACWSASSRCPHPAQPRGDPHDGHDSSAAPRTPCEEQWGQTSMPAPRSRERTRRGKAIQAANIDNPPDALASAAITMTPDARPPHPSRRTTVPATPRAPRMPAAHSLLRRRECVLDHLPAEGAVSREWRDAALIGRGEPASIHVPPPQPLPAPSRLPRVAPARRCT